jgi:hypothetical protein
VWQTPAPLSREAPATSRCDLASSDSSTLTRDDGDLTIPCDHQSLKSGNYKLEKFCLEPTSFTVKEESSFKGGESEFVKTKLMTRLTYTLDAVSSLLLSLSSICPSP